MYGRKESSLIRKNFWTRFGQYMRPVQGTTGEPVNWLNYKTGIRDIYFRMDADAAKAGIAIELRHSDPQTRQYYFNKLRRVKNILEEIVGEEWTWESDLRDETGISYSRIGMELRGVSIFRETDWSSIISFLKPRMIGLDEFWTLVKDGLE